ncbi:alpha-1,3/1,6-mannosyltransferase ALG2-like [Argiope bruennichi]|uniref:alpha-1,3/1,6-mannosyltransferase ALG2-like n=1 Tax=Argiope bruennichi TaxID=94029 RepID=UPI002493D263|nr:alpha-1,3/1,6-mannosyltransferase ALG2-like [Argiope bruennichi]
MTVSDIPLLEEATKTPFDLAMTEPFLSEEICGSAFQNVSVTGARYVYMLQNHTIPSLAGKHQLEDKLKRMLDPKEFSKVHLIIAGGYDDRVRENTEHYEELQSHVQNFYLGESVSFLKSPSDDAKRVLFHSCTAVLYTPSNEHFGIVPLEAMLLGRPVLACSSGGPLETVLHEQTGFLCDATPEFFASKMALLTRDRSLARELGNAASEHVKR